MVSASSDRKAARGLARKPVTWLCLGYLVCLFGVLFVLRVAGESSWLTCLALYLPRVALLVPVPLLSAWIAWRHLYPLLLTQLAALLIVVVPIMGFNLPLLTRASAQGPKLRVLSYNVNSVNSGADAVYADIAGFSPDIVLLQEISNPTELVQRLRGSFREVQASSQFVMASRFPILSSVVTAQPACAWQTCQPHYMQYLLDTSLGRIAVYSVHPVSPRGGFKALRGRGLSHELASGRFFLGEHGPVLLRNAAERSAQLRAVAEQASTEADPVIIAGDTNLPSLSPTLDRYFSPYRDGFREAGFGFGYTFPAKRAWMRIDRVFASEQLRFSSFEVGCASSDHSCVVADLTRAVSATPSTR